MFHQAAISAYYEQGESDDALASDSEPMRTSQQAAEPVAAAPAPVLRQAAEGTADARYVMVLLLGPC